VKAKRVRIEIEYEGASEPLVIDTVERGDSVEFCQFDWTSELTEAALYYAPGGGPSGSGIGVHGRAPSGRERLALSVVTANPAHGERGLADLHSRIPPGGSMEILGRRWPSDPKIEPGPGSQRIAQMLGRRGLRYVGPTKRDDPQPRVEIRMTGGDADPSSPEFAKAVEAALQKINWSSNKNQK